MKTKKLLIILSLILLIGMGGCKSKEEKYPRAKMEKIYKGGDAEVFLLKVDTVEYIYIDGTFSGAIVKK